MSLDEVMEAVEFVLEDIDTVGINDINRKLLLSLLEEEVFKIDGVVLCAKEIYNGDKAYNVKCGIILLEHPWIGDAMYEIKN